MIACYPNQQLVAAGKYLLARRIVRQITDKVYVKLRSLPAVEAAKKQDGQRRLILRGAARAATRTNYHAGCEAFHLRLAFTSDESGQTERLRKLTPQVPTRRSGPVRPGVGTSGERRFPRVLAISRGVGLPAVNQKGERTRSGLIWLRKNWQVRLVSPEKRFLILSGHKKRSEEPPKSRDREGSLARLPGKRSRMLTSPRIPRP